MAETHPYCAEASTISRGSSKASVFESHKKASSCNATTRQVKRPLQKVMSVDYYLNKKAEVGIPGYRMPQNCATVDDKLSLRFLKSRLCQDKSDYLTVHRKRRNFVPAPNLYNLDKTNSLKHLRATEWKFYNYDRSTQISDHMRAESQKNRDVSPSYYNPTPLAFKQGSAKVKGWLKNREERVFISDENSMKGKQTPGHIYKLPNLVSLRSL